MQSDPLRISSIRATPEHITLTLTLTPDCNGEVTLVGDVGGLTVHELEPYVDIAALEGPGLAGGIAFVASPAEQSAPAAESTVSLVVNRFDGLRDRLYSKFVVLWDGPTSSGSPCGPRAIVDGIRYVDVLDGVSEACYPYPASETIKGLQVKMVEDAIELGIAHAALNLNLPTVALPSLEARGPEATEVYSMDGREYYFDAEYLRMFDGRVKALSDRGVTVTLILLNSIRWDGREIHPDMMHLLHPNYDREGFISAFNVMTEQGLRHFKAFVEFVAERYTRPDARYGSAPGFIVGNEVDSGWVWCNAGEMPVQDYVREYAVALRTTFYAARKKYSEARVYVSLDHYWTFRHQDNPLRYYPSKEIVDLLAAMSAQEGNFDWSVAYHPYPENLFNPDFWNDKQALPSFETPKITFKNIEVLADYLAQPEYMCGAPPRPRRIILSEQGFNSAETEESERLQAAAYCLAYRKVERIPSIDSFILHAHVDHREEFGLHLGLWRRDKESPEANAPGSPKPIYEVFRNVDGSAERRAAADTYAKAEVGDEVWAAVVR